MLQNLPFYTQYWLFNFTTADARMQIIPHNYVKRMALDRNRNRGQHFILTIFIIKKQINNNKGYLRKVVRTNYILKTLMYFFL